MTRAQHWLKQSLPILRQLAPSRRRLIALYYAASGSSVAFRLFNQNGKHLDAYLYGETTRGVRKFIVGALIVGALKDLSPFHR